MTQDQVQRANRDLAKLAPFFLERLKVALRECIAHGYPVDLFEGYRSPDRQDWLYDQGRTRPGKVITNARAWQSWHQFGLAADIVGRTQGKWDWSIDYDRITVIMNRHGFESLKFEKPHFQITGGLTFREAKLLHDRFGIFHLWHEISKSVAA